MKSAVPFHFPQPRKALPLFGVAVAMLAALAPAPALAQVARTTTAETVIVRQLSFIKDEDLDFGTILPSATAGQVRLEPNGTRTATGGVTLVGSTHQAARFAGFGTYNQQVLISMSANTIQLTGPGAPMTVSQWEIGSTPTAILSTTPMRFRIGATNGVFNFPLGARLNVGANQAPGVYTGTFSITLNYQ